MESGQGITEAPAGWMEFLDESRDAVDRGDIIEIAPVLQRMRDAIAHLEVDNATVVGPEA